MTQIIITAVALITAIFLFVSLPSSTTLINSEGKKVLSKFGKWSLFGLSVFVLLPPIQYYFQDKEATRSENRIIRDLTSEYQRSVKDIQDHSNTNYDKTINTLATNLGIYKLALDSAKRLIVDSFPPPTKPQIPVLKILDISNGSTFTLKKQDSTGYIFSISFYSADATSCCFKIKCYVVAKKKDSNYLLIKTLGYSMLDYNEIIPKNTALVSTTTLKSIKDFGEIYLISIGNYKDATTKATYPINEISFYNPIGNSSGLIGDNKKEILDAIRK
ncbi:MAG: hypothetical protein ABI261_02460 [Ginsengibacter sp.]